MARYILGHFELAVEFQRKAVEKVPSLENKQALAKYLARSERTKEAKDLLLELTRLKEDGLDEQLHSEVEFWSNDFRSILKNALKYKHAESDNVIDKLVSEWKSLANEIDVDDELKVLEQAKMLKDIEAKRDAINNSEKLLAITLKVHGDQHSSTGTAYNNLGMVWRNKGEYDKAIEYYEKSLAIKLKVHGDQHPSMGTVYNNLGSVWSDKGEYDKAIEYYEKSLAINLKVRGKEHPEVTKLMFRTAQCYQELAENDKALINYLQCAELCKQRLGKDDETTQEAVAAARALAKTLGRTAELPVWMG